MKHLFTFGLIVSFAIQAFGLEGIIFAANFATTYYSHKGLNAERMNMTHEAWIEQLTTQKVSYNIPYFVEGEVTDEEGDSRIARFKEVGFVDLDDQWTCLFNGNSDEQLQPRFEFYDLKSSLRSRMVQVNNSYSMAKPLGFYCNGSETFFHCGWTTQKERQTVGESTDLMTMDFDLTKISLKVFHSPFEKVPEVMLTMPASWLQSKNGKRQPYLCVQSVQSSFLGLGSLEEHLTRVIQSQPRSTLMKIQEIISELLKDQ